MSQQIECTGSNPSRVRRLMVAGLGLGRGGDTSPVMDLEQMHRGQPAQAQPACSGTGTILPFLQTPVKEVATPPKEQEETRRGTLMSQRTKSSLFCVDTGTRDPVPELSKLIPDATTSL